MHHIFSRKTVLFCVWKGNLQEFYENVQELNDGVKGFKATIQRELCVYSVYYCGYRLQILTIELGVLDDDLLRGNENTRSVHTMKSRGTNSAFRIVTLKENLDVKNCSIFKKL